MTSNIDAIRAAKAQIPQMRDQLRLLRDEARADDGVVDQEERAEIEHVEGLIDTAHRLVAQRLAAWEADKAAYTRLRATLDTRLQAVAGSDAGALSGDQRKISEKTARVDLAADEEDYATALRLAQELQRLVDLFLQPVENARLNGLTPEELTQISLSDDAIEVAIMHNLKLRTQSQFIGYQC